MLSCVPYVLLDSAHPWLGRASIWVTGRVEQAFAPYADTTHGFRAVAAAVAKSGCQHVDLVTDGNDLEYLWWTALADAGWRGEMRNIDVWSYSAPLLERAPWRDFEPCARVSIVDNHARLVSAPISGRPGTPPP